MEQPNNELILEQATDTLVEAGWTLSVRIQEEQIADGGFILPDDFQLLLPTGAKVWDLKSELETRFGVPPEEQRFFARDTREPVLSGTLSSREGGRVSLLLKRVPIDARLKSLYEMVRMGDVEERDELMASMRMDRDAGQCPSGHALVAVERQEFRANRNLSYTCAKCRWTKTSNTSLRVGRVEQKVHVCKECVFALCTHCLSNDEGLTAAEDPHESIVDLARRLGGQFASHASWFGGKGHMCGHPSVSCGEEICPKAYRHSRFGKRSEDEVKVSRETKVLNSGIRLVVKLSEDIQAILNEAGRDGAPYEIDRVLADGATTGDIIECRGTFSRSPLWPVVAKELASRFPHYRTLDGSVAQAYTSCSLQSFDEQTASISYLP